MLAMFGEIGSSSIPTTMVWRWESIQSFQFLWHWPQLLHIFYCLMFSTNFNKPKDYPMF
ncbi:hypothetical protein NC652_011894 [Populus alba x Populus x berolinensis]|nr:hypothetical protein NC652_011894 [Populus alba x Populus x berolinensis]